MNRYNNRLHILKKEHESLISRKNKMIFSENGIFERYKYPILTAAHTPLEWRYDLNPETNPYLMERIGVNATMNSGAIKWNGKYVSCLLYTSPSPRDISGSRMPSSA